MIESSAHIDKDNSTPRCKNVPARLSLSSSSWLTRGVCGGVRHAKGPDPTRSTLPHHRVFHRQTFTSRINRHLHVKIIITFLSTVTLLRFVIHVLPAGHTQPCCQSLVCLPSILTLSISCISSSVSLHPNAWMLLLACSRFLMPTTGLTPLLML